MDKLELDARVARLERRVGLLWAGFLLAVAGVVDAVGGAVPVLVDGGIRSGVDVVRALALGAAAVLVGRPYLWGLAAGGEEGACEVIDALVADTARTLVLMGVATPAEVARYHVAPRAWD